MSVSNIVIAPCAVRIVTDTCSYLDKEPITLNRKVTLSAAGRFAFTVRGLHVAHLVLRRCAETIQWPDFNAALLGITAALPELSDRFLGGGVEVTLAGWEEGPRVVRLIRRPREEALDRYEFEPGVYLAPTLGAVQIPTDLTESQLVSIAHIQQELSNKHGLALCIGGDIELTEITERGVDIRVIGEYPDKALMMRRIAQRAPAPDLAAQAVA